MISLIYAALLLIAPAAPPQAPLPPVSILVTDTGYAIAACCERIILPLSPLVEAPLPVPHTFTTPVTDAKGRTHTVVTNCASYSDVKTCAKAHAGAVAAFEEYFQHVSPKKE